MSVDDFFSAPGVALVRSARALIHLANTALPGSNINSPWDELTQNVKPNYQCFMRAANLNAGLRIIYASSGGTVYGEGHSHPITEQARPAPISSYGVAKVVSEEVLAYVSRRSGIEYAILRIANPVGRWHRSRAQGLIEIAVAKAMAGEALPVFGDGSHVRDYFDADDLAEAFLTIAGSPKSIRGTWNIGSGRGRSVLEVVKLVEMRLNREVPLALLPARPWDVSYAVLDVAAALSDFGWSSRTPLETSIDKIIRHVI